MCILKPKLAPKVCYSITFPTGKLNPGPKSIKVAAQENPKEWTSSLHAACDDDDGVAAGGGRLSLTIGVIGLFLCLDVNALNHPTIPKSTDLILSKRIHLKAFLYVRILCIKFSSILSYYEKVSR